MKEVAQNYIKSNNWSQRQNQTNLNNFFRVQYLLNDGTNLDDLLDCTATSVVKSSDQVVRLFLMLPYSIYDLVFLPVLLTIYITFFRPVVNIVNHWVPFAY